VAKEWEWDTPEWVDGQTDGEAAAGAGRALVEATAEAPGAMEPEV
jgi:hypothetical protein